MQGIIAPILTPFENSGRVAEDIWVSHAKRVLKQGAHYLSPFGTTGEALSVGIDARMSALECLVNAGVSPQFLMPGTGQTALSDTIELTRHAVCSGVAATMILPSFFNTDAGDDGQFRYFEAIVNGVDDNRLRVCLYNIPQLSGVPVSPELACRLNREFPKVFVAYKDSTGNWENTQSVIQSCPQLSVFPGTETLLEKALENGGSGCISASVNINAAALRTVYDGYQTGKTVDDLFQDCLRFREILQKSGLVRGLKSILAVTYNDRRWLNLRPPLLDADMALGHSLLKELGPLADGIDLPVNSGLK